MTYTVAQLKKMNTTRLANLVKRAQKEPSQRAKLTLRKATRILESRAS